MALKLLDSYDFDEWEGIRRDLALLDIAEPRDFPKNLSLLSRYFLSFVLWDAGEASEDDFRLVARRLFDEGCVYMSAFGLRCEDFHDEFDKLVMAEGVETDDDHVIMTTWHSKEPFEDALWFGLFTAEPSEAYAEECKTTLVVSIGSHAYRDHLAEALQDVAAFNDRVLDAKKWNRAWRTLRKHLPWIAGTAIGGYVGFNGGLFFAFSGWLPPLGSVECDLEQVGTSLACIPAALGAFFIYAVIFATIGGLVGLEIGRRVGKRLQR